MDPSPAGALRLPDAGWDRSFGSASAWTPAPLRASDVGRANLIPLLGDADRAPAVPGLQVWDMWPLAHPDGSTAEIAGGRLWFSLSAPQSPDPDARHEVARIRLLHETPRGRWRDLGDALPDGFAPGAREWSGSAVLVAAGAVRLFFTATGRRGRPAPDFEQRLFQTDGRLEIAGGTPRLSAWSPPVESVAADGETYVRTADAPVAPGVIKAWRDPAFFRDPRDGTDHLVFAASLADAGSPYDAAVGIARACDPDGRRWELLPPLMHATGFNRELERPHIVHRGGRLYLFFCTQHHMFAPGAEGPTGLYGMVADTLAGPWRPLNGDGLVLANPQAGPRQTYAWWVSGEGEVSAFVEHIGPEPRPDAPRADAARFGGTPAPFLQLTFDDDRVRLA